MAQIIWQKEDIRHEPSVHLVKLPFIIHKRRRFADPAFSTRSVLLQACCIGYGVIGRERSHPRGISQGQNRVSIDRLYYPQCSHSDYEYRNKSGYDDLQHEGTDTLLFIPSFLVMITATESEIKGI